MGERFGWVDLVDFFWLAKTLGRKAGVLEFGSFCCFGFFGACRCFFDEAVGRAEDLRSVWVGWTELDFLF